MASLVCAQLLFWARGDQDIFMYINSPGGIVTSGLAIYDTMQYIKPDVATLYGAGGVGSLLLTAGAANKRYSLPHARIMTHQPSGGFKDRQQILRFMQGNPEPASRLNKIYEKHSGKTIKQIEKSWIEIPSCRRAQEMGLIDEVVTKRPDTTENLINKNCLD